MLQLKAYTVVVVTLLTASFAAAVPFPAPIGALPTGAPHPENGSKFVIALARTDAAVLRGAAVHHEDPAWLTPPPITARWDPEQ